MALRLRKDVQKASYYVWFLGAQEARGLRGSRVLLSAIPQLIERSREQEPLKVTLQVSHKGMKIVQGSSKHFITHSAITCSIQTDDVVACVLLLYNPATKCPLHVHAYRCDSETTAQALHQQLQILINRPENQKRFAELESRLGLHSQPAKPSGAVSSEPKPTSNNNRRIESSPRRFDSSLGSDTGTSTRESECSEEHAPNSPTFPVANNANKVSLYDSLAAELRAKLNGNGPPLLLPPRDYDTVHRSKGNLAATELRRCRNSLIVGGPGSAKQGVSSRGSSGIGSDLAPSPERHEGHSSTDDEWNHENPEVGHRSMPISRSNRPADNIRSQYIEEQPVNTTPARLTSEEITPAYLYPRESPPVAKEKYVPAVDKYTEVQKRFNRSSSREQEEPQQKHQQQRSHATAAYLQKQRREEDEIKPIITRPRNFDARFREVLQDKRFIVPAHDEENSFEDEKCFDEKKYRQSSFEEKKLDHRRNVLPTEDSRFQQSNDKQYKQHESRSGSKYPEKDVEKDNGGFRENMTDRQKYRDRLVEKQPLMHAPLARTNDKKLTREDSVENAPQYRDDGFSKAKMRQRYYESPERHAEPRIVERTIDRNHNRSVERSNGSYSKDKSAHVSSRYDDVAERNPYKEPESIPYRESIEKMLKSPVMRYKSFDSSPSGGYRDVVDDADEQRFYREKENLKMFSGVHKKTNDDLEQPMRPKYTDDIRYRDEYPVTRYNNHPNEMPMRRRNMTDGKMRPYEDTPSEHTLKVSPKDRFNNAKEKFQQMELERLAAKSSGHHSMPMEDGRRGSFEAQQPVRMPVRQRLSHDPRDGWSSDEEPQSRNSSRAHQYREIPVNERYPGLDKEAPPRMLPAKSLGNLVKGYRHSYAEPVRHPMPRNSGRVGLAAVNPY